MRIEAAEVIVTSPDRNFVTLRVTTDEGLVGLGDATLNGRELAVVSYLKDHVAPLLIGRDAHAIEDTWQFLYRGAYWRRGPVTMTATVISTCATVPLRLLRMVWSGPSHGIEGPEVEAVAAAGSTPTSRAARPRSRRREQGRCCMVYLRLRSRQRNDPVPGRGIVAGDLGQFPCDPFQVQGVEVHSFQ